MSPVVHFLLLVGAFACFGLAAWQPAAPTWNRVVSVGLLLLTASMIPW